MKSMARLTGRRIWMVFAALFVVALGSVLAYEQIYRQPGKMETDGPYPYMVCGKSCLAGDVFGTYRFPGELRPGDVIPFADAAGYTMVKKNWFNGLPMPATVVRRLDGTMEVVQSSTYADFVRSL